MKKMCATTLLFTMHFHLFRKALFYITFLMLMCPRSYRHAIGYELDMIPLIISYILYTRWIQCITAWYHIFPHAYNFRVIHYYYYYYSKASPLRVHSGNS